MFGVSQSLLLCVPLAVYFCVDLVLSTRYDKRRANGGSGRSLYTMITIIVALTIMLQPVLLPNLSLRISAWWFAAMQIGGVALAIVGLMALIWARLHLKQYYTEYIEVQESHQVITTGPYAYVRHPMFTLFFLITFGWVLINPSVFTVAAFIYTLVDFTSATKQEEELLLERAPGYVEYMSKTPRFLPGWRK